MNIERNMKYIVIIVAIIFIASVSVAVVSFSYSPSTNTAFSVNFSSNGSDPGGDYTIAAYNLVVNLTNPTTIAENSLQISLNSTSMGVLTGSYNIIWESNGANQSSSGHEVIWYSAESGPGFIIFFSSSNTKTVTGTGILDIFYGSITISGSNVHITPYHFNTWSGMKAILSYSGYSGTQVAIL